MNPMTTATAEQRILTGMILWEAYLDDIERFPGIEAAQAQHGSLEVRHRFVDRLIDAAHEVFENAVAAGYGSSFDFDFAGDFLAYLTDATHDDAADTAPMLRLKADDFALAGQLLAMRERVNAAEREISGAINGLCGTRAVRPARRQGKVWPLALDAWPTI